MDLWNDLLAHGYARVNDLPVVMPSKRTRWSGRGRLWERQPRHEQVYSTVASLDRRSGKRIYQLPLTGQPCFEFEHDLFTDQAAVTTVELRHGLRGPVEVVARGTDEAAVKGAFVQALEEATQLYSANYPEADDDGPPGGIVTA